MLLKTPTSNLATNGGSQHPLKRKDGGHGPTLADEVEWLLPGGAHFGEIPAGHGEGVAGGQLAVPVAAPGRCRPGEPVAGEEVWGRYAPAIARWEERLGRDAPSALDGRGRLSAVFVEWMMGLRSGWVTRAGVPRAAQFAALGNGVVPAQAAGAVGLLLARAGEEGVSA
ncbi:DNA (cytosine-5-)-methyltransferase [Streptomyces tsukubensis]